MAVLMGCIVLPTGAYNWTLGMAAVPADLSSVQNYLNTFKLVRVRTQNCPTVWLPLQVQANIQHWIFASNYAAWPQHGQVMEFKDAAFMRDMCTQGLARHSTGQTNGQITLL